MIPWIREKVKGIQAQLNFETWSEIDYPQFARRGGLGRVALLGCILGFCWGFHFVILIQLTIHLIRNTTSNDNNSHDEIDTTTSTNTNNNNIHNDRIQLYWQWCAYFTCLCSFHMLEFFVTALYNPTQATADSFLINHSTAYTAAALTSWTEFWFRVGFIPRYNVRYLSWIGLILVVLSQYIRSTAMATAGESFNHLIQTSKKDNHLLVTHGIYSILRHPSYVGFFYWSIATQLLLGNVLHSILFAVASWNFFLRRIEYEEESLCKFFPDTYPAYVARTYMGIPFLRTKVDTSGVQVKKNQ